MHRDLRLKFLRVLFSKGLGILPSSSPKFKWRHVRGPLPSDPRVCISPLKNVVVSQ